MAKEKKCALCSTVLEQGKACSHCGALFSYNPGATLIYSREVGKHIAADVYFTNKYIVMTKANNNLLYSFGLIGLLIGEAVNAGKKKNYGFYSIDSIRKVEYPIQKMGAGLCSWDQNKVIHFINDDGTDFYIGVMTKKDARRIADAFREKGVPVENLSACLKKSTACENPFIDRNTFDKHNCVPA